MKAKFIIILAFGLIGLSNFTKDTKEYEQTAFEYFVSDILPIDFKDIKSLEFKGETEESYSTLGKYIFCLKPVEKLGVIIGDATKGVKRSTKKIDYENIAGIKIVDFQKKVQDNRLFVYPSLHVADSYYVFILLQKPNENPIKYIVELTPDGTISRSCKMD